jgi:hypothetical protein
VFASLYASKVLKVLYAPQKAFKEIMQDARYLGPAIILVAYIIANFGVGYAFLSRIYVEETYPQSSQPDYWIQNTTLWTASPDVVIAQNFVDIINGSYYGNSSLQFSATDVLQVWMQLNNVGPVNCSGPEGFKNMSLRVKQVSPNVVPENVSIYLFSANSSEYFFQDLTSDFSNPNSSVDVWNNLTIPVNTPAWSSSSVSAHWSNITGLKLDFTWHDTSNVTLLLDGLFFRGIYTSGLQIVDITYYFNTALTSFMQFVVNWVLIAILLYLLTKVFKVVTVWKVLLILIGFSLVTLVVLAIVNIISVYAIAPPVYYPLELLGGTLAESSAAEAVILQETNLITLVTTYEQFAFAFWGIGLVTIAFHYLTNLAWIKSAFMAFITYWVAFFVTRIILSI